MNTPTVRWLEPVDPSPADFAYYYDHARTYALRQDADAEQADRYAIWYVTEYPAGDASHGTTFWRWLDSQSSR